MWPFFFFFPLREFFQDFYNFLLDSGSDSVSSLAALELSKQIATKKYSRYLSMLRPTPGGGNSLDSLMNGAIRKKLRIIPENVM